MRGGQALETEAGPGKPRTRPSVEIDSAKCKLDSPLFSSNMGQDLAGSLALQEVELPPGRLLPPE